MQQSHLVSLVPLFPLISGILVGLLALFRSHTPDGPNKHLVAFLAVLGPAASAVVAIMLFGKLADAPGGFVHTAYTWFATGNLSVPVAFYADRLSGVMILIVTFIGTLIHLYSVGYMWQDRGFARFFSYLNLFTFSMLVLVLGKNMPLMFLGWEGVGAMSYLLIGFWFKDTDKAVAANKAFIVNRIGDFGMLIGMFVLFYYMGSKGVWTFDFVTLRQHADLITPVMATVIGLLLFVGASGKSAQVPLHVWLADAMAGPTPVSALIHAATMVTAGIYMVARMSFLYTLTPTASTVIMVIGGFTAFMAASIAVTQSNIKKVLAYSTLSQLGYMFMGVGAGAYASGVFHLLTHAFFKALLFLGAGAVIHAMHHHEEMQHYGGLRKKIPFTFAIMLIGCLAIAGIPPFAGFFSKDAILAAVYETGHWELYLVGLLTSGITAFYMFRMLFLTFFGAPRDHHTYEGAHEGPWQMNLPLGVLAAGTCLVGFIGAPAVWGGSSFAEWLAPAFPAHAHHALAGDALVAAHTSEYMLMAFAVAAGAIGILLAWVRYGSHATPRFSFAANPFWNFANHKWLWDEMYQAVIVGPLVAFSRRGLWRTVDEGLIDGAVNGLPRAYLGLSQTVRFAQTGAVRLYAYAMLLGVLGILAYVVFRFNLLRFSKQGRPNDFALYAVRFDFLPLVAGVFILLFGEDDHPGFARGAALAATVLNMLLSLVLLAPSLRFEEKAAWLPQFGIGYHLRVDGLSLWLILLVTFSTPVAVLASWKLIQSRAKVYYGCMLLLSGGMIGVLCAMDLFLFYVFWEIMLIPAFFLVGVFGGPKARPATMKFAIYTMVGSLLMLVGIVYAGYQHFVTTGAWSFNLLDLYGQVYPATGVATAAISTYGHWAFLAFALAFLIKAALFPLHTWLPDTYTEAPAPVTFLLSAVMAKLGIYGILRIANPLFPDAARDFAPFFIGLAVIGVIYAALIALVQEDAKRLVAYASISHLGIITMAVFTTSPQALSGAVLHMVAHALTTGALFLLVGFLYERTGSTLISAYGGITKAIPVFATVFLLVTLASVGLPGLAGFVGEFMIFLGTFRDHPVAAGIATVSVILGASYMLWMFQRTMFGPVTSAENNRLPDFSMREGLIFVPICALIIGIGLFPQLLLNRINPAVESYIGLTRSAGVASRAVAAPAEPVQTHTIHSTENAPHVGGGH